MSPMIAGKNKEENYDSDKIQKSLKVEKNNLIKIRNYIEKNIDYVGENFSKKVREIYYDKKTSKTIYGTTTKEERKELAEEGIDLITIPWVEKDN